MAKVHHLKTWPPHFQEVRDGKKTFELRLNDRNFQVGDFLVLEEYEPDKGYTGRSTARRITHILTDWFGLVSGFCILSLDASHEIEVER